jgi:dihydrofolate reductase
MISLIAAMTQNEHVIGNQGVMPWHLPADLAWFKQNTLAKPIIMGRKTWQSLGKVLPGRRNIVVSADTSLAADNVEFVSTPEQALERVQASPEVMIIGGAQLYRYFLPQAERMYLTLIAAHLKGDTFFPTYSSKDWQIIQQQDFLADSKNAYNYSFNILERI